MMSKSVLLDTSFFIRFLNENDPLFQNADNYYKKFLEQGITLYISTISIAEYCIGGNITELPLKNLKILPFNIEHAKRAGVFAKIVFDKREQTSDIDRKIIPNDTNLFFFFFTEVHIAYYLTLYSKSKKVYEMLKDNTSLNFTFIDLNVSYEEYFGELAFT